MGGSSPDPSMAQDETIGEALGAKIAVPPTLSPNPMTLGGGGGGSEKDGRGRKDGKKADRVSKCNHFLAFYGGNGKTKNLLTKIKLELLMKDFNITGK